MEISPNIIIDELDWIGKHCEVVFKGLTMDFEPHSAALNKWFEANVISMKVGSFVTLVRDVVKNKVLVGLEMIGKLLERLHNESDEEMLRPLW